MPLLGKKPFVSGSQLNSDSAGPVYEISHTKERFSSESEYQKRKELYAQCIWTCRATGHINLTHEEAIKSEQAGASQLKEQFAKCFEKDVLEIVHHNTSSLDSLVDQTWLKLHQQLVLGEKVNLKVKVADKLIPAKVTSIDKSQAESKEGNDCNSPSSDKENSSEDKDKTPKKWTPPKLLPYLYSIELDQEAKVIHSVPGDDLVRLERIPSKDLLRLFIRVTALRSGTAATSPWVVNEDLVLKYKLVNKFNDFFLSPAKMAEAAKRADENKKKRKLSNGVQASACKKLKLDGKSKKDGKKLKVLQLNKTVKEKKGKKEKDGKKSPKKLQQKSLPKKSSPKKSCIVLSDSDDDIALSKLQKDKPSSQGSESDSDIPLYQLVDQTTPKKKQPVKSKSGLDSSDEDVPLARISPSKKSQKKKEKMPSKKQTKEKKMAKDLSKKAVKESKKSSKTGMKQATLFDLSKKGKTVVQKTPVKKSPSKTATPTKSSPPIPPIIRRLQNAKRESIQDKMKFSMMLKNAACILTPAQLKRAPEKLREEIERKKAAMDEKTKMSKMSAEEKEKYLSEKKNAAKKLQNQKMLQRMRDQRKRFEDTDLDLTPLPTPKMVATPEGFPNNLFGEVAMVTEFINCFGGLLMPDSEYPIFTDPLMKALVGGSNGFTYLSRVLTVLLQTLLQDEIAKGYKELNTLLSDIPVSAYTASELMRLCLRCEEDEDDMEDQDDETTKSIQLLNDTEFYKLELDQKLNLMSGLCSRVLETYSAQDYMEEQQKEVNKLLKQKASEMKQIAAQKKTEKQDSPVVNKTAKSDDVSSSNENENADKDSNGCRSITSFYGKETAQDSGEEGTNWGSVVKRRRVLAAQAAAEKEKRDRERAAQIEKENQLEKVRRKQEQLLDAINLARMVLRQDPIGTDRHHDRYWVFTNTTPGLYIEKGWMGEEVHYSAHKSQNGSKMSDDEDMLSASDSDDNSANVTANQTGMTPMKVKYQTKRQFIEKSAPHPGQNIWLTYRSVKDLDTLLKALHPQGIRESLLKGEVKKRYDDIAKAITLSQRASLELRNSDGNVEMVSSYKKELCDMELRLRNGGLGGVPDYSKWEDRLNEATDITVLGDCMLEVQSHVTEKFVQGFMKSPVKTEGTEGKADVKEEDVSEQEEESVIPKKKEDKNEKAFRMWKESVASCLTMSRLHVLLSMLDSCIKWEKSAENAKCKICRKKCDDDCLLLCDECNQAFHMYCLRPALSRVPTTDWFCPSCKPRRAQVSARLIESDSEEADEEKQNACRECGGEDQLIVCSKCPYAYHPECHDPPLRRPPRGVWECSDCKSGVNWKRKKQLSRKVNQRKNYIKTSSQEESEEEESEDEDDYTPKRKYSRTRNAKPQSNGSGNKKAGSARSQDRKGSMRESTSSVSSSLTPTSRTSRRGPSELSLCEEVLSRVVKHKMSWPFLEPVDKKQVPDYHVLIKKPMDFQTMQKNCARLNYASPQEFIEDAALVFENAESYNKPDSEVFECMKEVEKVFKEQLKKLLPEWPYYRSVVEYHGSSNGIEAGKRRSRNKQ